MSDVHQHYCRQCRTPWEHDGDALQSNPEIRAAHRCPACGTPGWVKYYGNETHDEMCQLEALLEASEDDRLPDGIRDRAERDFARLASRLHRGTEPSDESVDAQMRLRALLRELGVL